MTPGRKILLRPGRPADVPSLVPLSGSAERRVLAADAGDEALLVVEHVGRVVAAVSVRWQDTCDPPHPWLYSLHVRPDVRRHGIGALLVRAAETVASLHGAAAMSTALRCGSGARSAPRRSRGVAVR